MLLIPRDFEIEFVIGSKIRKALTLVYHKRGDRRDAWAMAFVLPVE